MFRLLWSRIILMFLGLMFVGSVSMVDSDTLYVSCSVGSERDTAVSPIERDGSDSAFFAEQTIASEYNPVTRVTDLGFTHLVGMWNITTVRPCDRGAEATVEFRAFKILEQDLATGETSMKQTVTFDDAQWDEGVTFDYLTYHRSPWFTGGGPAVQPIVAALGDGIYSLNARFIPKGIIHGWTTPRVEAVAGKSYLIEAEVRVSGDARLQLGMDYWRGVDSNYNGWSEGCITSNNCQVWLSDWLGDTGGEFVTWRVPVRIE